ncbi:hypothetical protein L6452_05814 [Arctium lappa]|uniref:Uncharacterized protein n=1 Tax=Arctium lappa TaxID=4217 RepID=A0ACB9EGV1_ARCLA|nr:hypothetical protein L6452_05814 [Arctium lappa]
MVKEKFKVKLQLYQHLVGGLLKLTVLNLILSPPVVDTVSKVRAWMRLLDLGLSQEHPPPPPSPVATVRLLKLSQVQISLLKLKLSSSKKRRGNHLQKVKLKTRVQNLISHTQKSALREVYKNRSTCLLICIQRNQSHLQMSNQASGTTR